MRYLMLVCSDGQATEEKAAAMRAGVPAWVQETERRGVRLGGHALAGPSSAVTVRVRNGETIVSDGPFIESKEFVGGFDVLECADLDQATEIAAKHPVARYHALEVRPFASLRLANSEAREHETPDLELIDLDRPVPAGHARYALLMCLDGIPEADDVEEAILQEGIAWRAAREESGEQVFGHPLAHADTATTVRVRDGRTLLSDGPFVETREFIGGFDVIDCRSREEAIGVAALHPLARFHMIEVRPFATDALGDADAA